jgi:hypothetical protein
MARRMAPALTGGADGDREEWIDMPVKWEPKETATGQAREGRLIQRVEDYAHRSVTLRNGAGEMPLIKAAEAQTDLCDLLRDDPALFPALRALADGRREEVSREQVKALREWGVLTVSGRVRSDLQIVLKAAYEEKDGQPSIAGLAEMVMPEDAAVVRRFLDWEKEIEERTDTYLERRRQERNQGQGRG